MTFRQSMRDVSNNPSNANKNLCGLAVARAFGVEGATRYLHTAADIHRALRTRYSVRSAMSYAKAQTVGAARKNLAAYAATQRTLLAYVVIVDGHVLVMGPCGKTLLDTAPRKNDRRKMKLCHAVYAA